MLKIKWCYENEMLITHYFSFRFLFFEVVGNVVQVLAEIQMGNKYPIYFHHSLSSLILDLSFLYTNEISFCEEQEKPKRDIETSQLVTNHYF